jgi:hypothetical protein
MKRKVTQQDFNKIKAGMILYKYPVSGPVAEEFNDHNIEDDYNEYLVNGVNPGKYVSFQQNITANIAAGYMTIVEQPIHDMTELLNGYWWMEDN